MKHYLKPVFVVALFLCSCSKKPQTIQTIQTFLSDIRQSNYVKANKLYPSLDLENIPVYHGYPVLDTIIIQNYKSHKRDTVRMDAIMKSHNLLGEHNQRQITFYCSPKENNVMEIVNSQGLLYFDETSSYKYAMKKGLLGDIETLDDKQLLKRFAVIDSIFNVEAHKMANIICNQIEVQEVDQLAWIGGLKLRVRNNSEYNLSNFILRFRFFNSKHDIIDEKTEEFPLKSGEITIVTVFGPANFASYGGETRVSYDDLINILSK